MCLSLVVGTTRSGVSTIILTGRWQLNEMRRYFVPKVGPIAIALLTIMITLPILQPALATATNSPTTNTTIDDNNNEFNNSVSVLSSNQSGALLDKTDVTLRGLFTDLANPGRWNQLLQPALDELNRRHPDMNIKIEYNDFPYNITRNQILDRLSNGESVDIVSVDQIWLGEFADKGLLRNLTADFEQWGGMSDLYEANLDGCVYNNTIYGLWLWTDIRGMWYWKDMLQEAGVDPESLKTWDGYISAAVRLDDFFGDRVIQGVHLLGASHDLDLWYPYLWMLGGEILELREGHPTKGVYWFPSYNSSEGLRAMEFLRRQVDAGIQPQERPYLEGAFPNRNFSVMLGGSWMPGEFPRESWLTLEQQVGFIPMFPVPNQTIQTSTMMGGWELAIPSTSQNSDLSWELITIMAQPEILGPFIQEHGYLPTQQVLGDGPFSEPLKQSVPYFEEMVSMIPHGRSRPNIPEYPEIAEDIHHAIQQVYNGSALPEDALNTAAAKSADSLGWK
ncbi:MAG TPA: extracellular solute-binding protein [Nitrososphaeraceae archaeon]|nr:extracellular solute-binding protein [Nitrososphaeraceae archaeon]